MDRPHGLVVAGSGPAGTVAALGLHKMGFAVTVVTSPRGFVACEGISERVVQGLHSAGIQRALDTVAASSPRRASWGGELSEANTERLVRRDLFDRALLQDLEDAGVRVIHGRVGQTRVDDSGIQVSGSDNNGELFSLAARFFVDARGRSAPGSSQARMRGPETVSLLQAWRGEPGESQSTAAGSTAAGSTAAGSTAAGSTAAGSTAAGSTAAGSTAAGSTAAGSTAASFADGWAWMARFSDGSRYTQLTLAAEDIPPRRELADFFHSRLRRVEEAEPLLAGATPAGELHARSATAILHCDPINGPVIRVGDAALAVDPLSGNGIFQSISTALLAPRVINTVLNRPGSAELARQFYRERVNHAFMRFARMGRDFYRLESRWLQQTFWQQRQDWPDRQPMHEPAAPDKLQIERRPVVSGDFIDEAEVVVTPDQPLGIWHLAGIELAPLVRAVRERQSQAPALQAGGEAEDFVRNFLRRHTPDATAQLVQGLIGWLAAQRLLPPP